jgi:hypothetical protein
MSTNLDPLFPMPARAAAIALFASIIAPIAPMAARGFGPQCAKVIGEL